MDFFGVLRRRWLVLALGLVAAATLVDAAVAQELKQTPDCIQFWPEARAHSYAYDHIVHVRNACEAQAICAVSSDDAPTPVNTTVAPGQEVEVLLNADSPTREFVPRVQCGLVI